MVMIKEMPKDNNESFSYQLINPGNDTLTKDTLIDAYTSQGYLTNPKVFAVTSKLYQMFARMSFEILDSKDSYISELEGVLERPNSFQTWTEFLECWELHGLLWGNSIVYVPKFEGGNNKGMPMFFELLPIKYVTIRSQNNMPIYEYCVGGSMKTIPAADIWHTRLYQNPDYSGGANYLGVSPLKVAAQMIASSNEGLSFLQKVYSSPMPPAILVREETQYGNTSMETDDQEQKSFEKSWLMRQLGKKKAVPMFARGKLNLLQTKISTVTDLQIVQVNQMLLEEICNIYGVPAQLFNSTNSSTESNVKLAHRAIYTNVLIPHAEKFIDGFNQFLKPKKQRLNARYSEIPELQDDKQLLATWTAVALQNGVLSPNEVRELIGLDIIDLPEMNQRYINASLSPLGIDFADLEDEAFKKMI